MNAKKLASENVFVEKKERVSGKPYYKVSVPEKNDDGKTKNEVKRKSNREIRKTNGSLPKGKTYKKGSEAFSDDE